MTVGEAIGIDLILESFKIDPHAEEMIKSSIEWGLHVEKLAEAAAEAARAAFEGAGPHPYETGAYIDSIEPFSGVENGEWIGRVNAFDFKAWWLEVGTSDTPAFAALRRGADTIGLHVEAEAG